MDDILEFDVNEIVKDEVKSMLRSYEDKLNMCRDENYKLKKEISELKNVVKSVEDITFLLNYIKNEYTQFKNNLDRFLFIENIMCYIFNIKGEYKPSTENAKLEVLLAINYYKHKDTIINILKIINPDYCSNKISFITDFRMPYDYSKEEVMEYVKNPSYNTNGCMFGISIYWIELEAKKKNMPHDLIMKNPHILEDDVFNILINTINKHIHTSHYLFAVAKHNENISDNQIKQLGECLIKVPASWFGYECVKQFIRDNILNFNTKTLDYLYGFASNDNQFKLFYWENFPVMYQMEYLKSKSFEKVFGILSDRSCKWSIEDKERFLKGFIN